MSDIAHPTPAADKQRFGTPRPKVAPFARYRGTSAWRKYRNRVKAYSQFQAAAKQAGASAH